MTPTSIKERKTVKFGWSSTLLIPLHRRSMVLYLALADELLLLLLLLLALAGPACAVEPQTSNSSATVDGDLLSVTSWHARTLTNVSWEVPWWRRNSTHLIVVTWDEEATEETWWPSDPDDNSRAQSPPSSTMFSTYFPSTGEDIAAPDLCTYPWDAFSSQSNDAFVTDANRALVSVDLVDEHTWWFTASLDQDKPNATSPTSGVGQASVLLSEPGFYTACLLLVVGDDETCPTEECVDFTVYQPPYDFLEVSVGE